ncbi:MAG: PG0541 family transporter-associated protein [Bacteroidales bacterium]|jgi:nitrogen regulatory protein PII
MKAVMIIYDQAHSANVLEILDKCSIRGFTKWDNVHGRGSKKGDPHYSSHAWPSTNMVTLAITEEEKIPALIEELKALNDDALKQGLRVFTWEAESAI